MRSLPILFAFLLPLLYACGAAVSTNRVSALPPEKRTVTVTETVKIDRPVPVYRTETTLESRTRTIGGKDLHRVEVAPIDAPAAK